MFFVKHNFPYKQKENYSSLSHHFCKNESLDSSFSMQILKSILQNQFRRAHTPDGIALATL